jgi:hypothetical protein
MPVSLYSKRREAPTLGTLQCTVPEHFTLETVKEKNRYFVSMLKYKEKPFASISWHQQNHVMAFVIPHSSIFEWKTMPEAVEALVMMALLLRLKGEM